MIAGRKRETKIKSVILEEIILVSFVILERPRLGKYYTSL
jgi:hypothetical protein